MSICQKCSFPGERIDVKTFLMFKILPRWEKKKALKARECCFALLFVVFFPCLRWQIAVWFSFFQLREPNNKIILRQLEIISINQPKIF